MPSGTVLKLKFIIRQPSGLVKEKLAGGELYSRPVTSNHCWVSSAHPTVTKTEPIWGCANKPWTGEHAPSTRTASLLMHNSEGCTIATTELPDPTRPFPHPYIGRRAQARVLTPKESPRSRKQFLVEFKVFTLLPLRIAPFSVRMEFWRGTRPASVSDGDASAR
jgi:hypothetical protein